MEKREILKEKLEIIKKKLNEDATLKAVQFKKRLYSFITPIGHYELFDTEEDLLQHSDEIGAALFVVDFIGDFTGKKDVIRKTSLSECVFETVVDYLTYCSYDMESSNWKNHIGSIFTLHSAFKERGISLDNDVYAENAEFFEAYQDFLKCEQKKYQKEQDSLTLEESSQKGMQKVKTM